MKHVSWGLLEDLPPAEEQQVADLLEEYSDRVYAGEAVGMEEYMAQCPNERMREMFHLAADMVQVLEVCESLNDEEPGMDN